MYTIFSGPRKYLAGMGCKALARRGWSKIGPMNPGLWRLPIGLQRGPDKIVKTFYALDSQATTISTPIMTGWCAM